MTEKLTMHFEDDFMMRGKLIKIMNDLVLIQNIKLNSVFGCRPFPLSVEKYNQLKLRITRCYCGSPRIYVTRQLIGFPRNSINTLATVSNSNLLFKNSVCSLCCNGTCKYDRPKAIAKIKILETNAYPDEQKGCFQLA